MFREERSIPACAGEPDMEQKRADRARVYPRVCGGTRDDDAEMSIKIGLSPRVRGNLHLLSLLSLYARSIPACAGEPYQSRTSCSS